jgi:GT2 family glycosyltransferase
MPKLSVVIPFYDLADEAKNMVRAVHESLAQPNDVEYLLVDIGRQPNRVSATDPGLPDRCAYLTAPHIPAAKNLAVRIARGELILFLFPPLFPYGDTVERMMNRLDEDRTVAAVAGRWRNASGKVEVGYNIRRFPTLAALLVDILLLNKLLPRNRTTRSYKMHDFGHNVSHRAEHANDCALMVRRAVIMQHREFNEDYAPGWFDQVEFCEKLKAAGGIILFDPKAEFIANENLPLISRVVRDQYPDYRRAEYRYIRQHFGRSAAAIACFAIAIGMIVRLTFCSLLPRASRLWLLSSLRSYVNDQYISNHKNAYWKVLKSAVRGSL